MTLGKMVDIKSFTSPEEGFEYIETEYIETKYHGTKETNFTILFLDLNMPLMSGWEFLERFDNLGSELKGQISLYILSSSVDSRDRERSYANKNVKGYIAKPLTIDIINNITHSEIKKR
jgi:CheY-like chemotaxis protein